MLNSKGTVQKLNCLNWNFMSLQQLIEQKEWNKMLNKRSVYGLTLVGEPYGFFIKMFKYVMTKQVIV